MPVDVFNNPSNDYINPGLPPCSNVADDYTFEFLPRQEAGIISGADIIQSMYLGDVVVPITSWTSEKKTLAAGEVIYVPGLTKGLMNKVQVFPNLSGSTDTNQLLYLMLDLSINYYNNFSYTTLSVNASANSVAGTDIASALNIAFAVTGGPKVTATFGTSGFTFVGNQVGYEFEITGSPILTLIDASMANGEGSPFSSHVDPSTGLNVPVQYSLIENSSSAIPAAKYPNGAMRGYIMKGYFPSTSGETDRWFYMNNVKSPFASYESVLVNRHISSELVDSSTYYNIFQNSSVDVSILSTAAISIDASYYLDASMTILLDVSVLVSPTVVDSSIIYSAISDASVLISAATFYDVSLYNADGSLVNVTIYQNPEVLSTVKYYSGLIEAVDVSVLVSPSASAASLYYNKFIKRVDVGRNYPGDANIMNAGEYLAYIDNNKMWDTVSDFRAHITSLDPGESNITNLIGGFYLFNPHDFSIQIEYMLIN